MPPPVLLAALRPGVLRLAAAEADGVILNWLAADEVPTALAELGERRPGFEVAAARIFVCRYLSVRSSEHTIGSLALR